MIWRYRTASGETVVGLRVGVHLALRFGPPHVVDHVPTGTPVAAVTDAHRGAPVWRAECALRDAGDWRRTVEGLPVVNVVPEVI